MIYNLAVTFSVNLNFSHGLTVAGRVLLDFYLSLSILGVNVYAVKILMVVLVLLCLV